MPQWTASVGSGQLARLLGPRRRGDGPAYRALADGIRLLVTDGRVAAATRLPAERELAGALGVSRTTVAAAYQALRAEGFLQSRRGAGSWTALPRGWSVPTAGVRPVPADRAGRLIDLGAAAMPAPEPWLSRAMAEAVAEMPAFTASHGHFAAGVPQLREALAARFTARGVPTMPEQILVTGGGAMGALGLVCGLLVDRADRVAVEAPAFPNALALLERTGARRVPAGIGADGWDLEDWRRVLRDAVPRLAYVVPDFHNPTGALVPDAHRRELVERARASGTVVVADETMAELVLDPGTVLPRPMASFDPGGSTVVTVGSASKVFWMGLRIGWVRAAPALVRRMAAARTYVDLGAPVLEQMVVLRLLTAYLGPALELQRTRMRGNRDALVAALRRALPEWEYAVPSGGLTLWARTGGLPGPRVAAAGERTGVRVVSGPRFGVDGAFESYVRLTFSVPGERAEEAVERLAEAVRLVRAGAAPEGEAGTFIS